MIKRLKQFVILPLILALGIVPFLCCCFGSEAQASLSARQTASSCCESHQEAEHQDNHSQECDCSAIIADVKFISPLAFNQIKIIDDILPRTAGFIWRQPITAVSGLFPQLSAVTLASCQDRPLFILNSVLRI